MNIMKFISSITLSILFATSALTQAPDKDKVIAGAERAVDKIAKTITLPAPGCAVGVSLNGETVFEKALGLAEMEHNIPNTPQTIFESGSVAKQFTAAAVVLLAQEGKLSLDDPVKKYIPELPDYGAPLTIRHILNHTAGLRDWGSVMALTGAGRGDRVITQDLALDVIVHQKALDFTPGAEYSYSNSGYQLAAIIVERVSKQKFADFVGERLFKPLGMKNSTWRDDYRRLVPGRAQAYSRDGNNAPWRLNMPFMNVYGNGGMLTTVGDWLKWNAMLDSRSLGAPLVEALETQGVLNDGRKINYALGLEISKYRGLREVSHGGSTAGYQTFLARYPDKKVSVAVLCNGTSPSAGGLAASITDEIFGPFPETAAAPATKVSAEELQKFVGIWREEKTRVATNFAVQGSELRMNGSPLRPQTDGSFLLGTSIRVTFKFDKDGKPVSAEGDLNGDVRRFIRETEWTPTSAELAQFAGEWYSEEADAKFTIAVEGDKVFLTQRPSLRLQLRLLYKDHLSAQGYTLWITRDPSGKVDRLHIGASRMRDMPFTRVSK
jgi:CubicO group peptidase (beta-lactamase class C family)